MASSIDSTTDDMIQLTEVGLLISTVKSEPLLNLVIKDENDKQFYQRESDNIQNQDLVAVVKSEQRFCDVSGKDLCSVKTEMSPAEFSGYSIGKESWMSQDTMHDTEQRKQCSDVESREEATDNCNLCDEYFSQPEKLKAHKLLHTVVDENPDRSAVCDKLWSRTSRSKSCMSKHTGGKRHYCTLCDKSFSRADSLKAHTLFHTGEKNTQLHFM